MHDRREIHFERGGAWWHFCAAMSVLGVFMGSEGGLRLSIFSRNSSVMRLAASSSWTARGVISTTSSVRARSAVVVPKSAPISGIS